MLRRQEIDGILIDQFTLNYLQYSFTQFPVEDIHYVYSKENVEFFVNQTRGVQRQYTGEKLYPLLQIIFIFFRFSSSGTSQSEVEHIIHFKSSATSANSTAVCFNN